MYHRSSPGKVTPQAPPTVERATLPASVGGMNSLNSLMGMPAEDCLYTHNLMPSEYGLRLRKGYREWASGLGASVNTIIGFEGQKEDGSSARMWAVTPNGIYNVSLYNTTAPVQDVPGAGPVGTDPWTNLSGQAGYGVYCETSNDANKRFLFYADGENGLFMYDETLDVWSVPAITATVPEDFDVTKVAFVTTWKNRLWFVMQDSGDGWYLPPDAIAGTVEKFVFGSKFIKGGDLRCLYSWTIDGGAGMDDYLIAVSHGGDVLVYAGVDPATIDFKMTGSFYIGEAPDSRRLGVDHGSELYLLSVSGLTSVRELLQGAPVETIQGVGPAAKISRFLRQDVKEGKIYPQWDLIVNPSEGFLQIIAPYTQGASAIQYTQNLQTQAWGMWKGVPVNSAGVWNDEYFIGDEFGSVWINDAGRDGTTLADGGGNPIEYDILTSFQVPGGDHSNYKRVGLIRTIGVLAGNSNYNIKPVYDYDISAVVPTPVSLPSQDLSLWDTALWDEAIWGESVTGASLITGGSGMGRAVALAMKGSSDTRFTLVGWDVTFTQGGFL